MNNPGFLSGIKVLDFSTMGMGPVASQQLRQWGADVLKIEFVRLGDPLKKMPCFGMNSVTGGTEVYHQINSGKRLWQFDPRSEQDCQRLQEELTSADVLIESFFPGRMAKWGLSSAELLPSHPRLIYASISAYGHADPRSQQSFHEANVMASNGVLSLLHPPGVPLSLHPGPAMTLSSTLCAEVLARLLTRASRPLSPPERFVDMSVDGTSRASAVFLWADEVADLPPPKKGHMVGSSPWSRVYPCANGTSLVVSLPEAASFDRLLKCVGLRGESCNGRCDEIGQQISKVLLTKSAPEWEQELLMTGVAVTTVKNWHGDVLRVVNPDVNGLR